MTESYCCLGPCPSSADIAVMNWQHPVVDEPTFTAPWTALKNAIDLATVIGESPALRQAEALPTKGQLLL